MFRSGVTLLNRVRVDVYELCSTASARMKMQTINMPVWGREVVFSLPMIHMYFPLINLRYWMVLRECGTPFKYTQIYAAFQLLNNKLSFYYLLDCLY